MIKKKSLGLVNRLVFSLSLSLLQFIKINGAIITCLSVSLSLSLLDNSEEHVVALMTCLSFFLFVFFSALEIQKSMWFINHLSVSLSFSVKIQEISW